MYQKQNIAIGVDIGGSHISCAGFDLDVEELLIGTLCDHKVDNHASSSEIISQWGETIMETAGKIFDAGIIGIGFAMPGPFDYVNGIPLFTGENEKFENIYGLNVPEALRAYHPFFQDLPIRFINDATAFAIGEDWVGQGRDVNRLLAITLGTGFGSAFIADQLPVLEGEIVPPNGCLWHLPFLDGISDDYFSTRGLIRRYEMLTGKTVQGVKDIAEQASTDPEVNDLFNDFGRQLVRFLGPWCKRFDVEMIVIGGNISKAYPLFGPAMKESIQNEELNMEVKVSQLMETSAFIGSARLVQQEFWEKVAPVLSQM